jgi:hypothetical protein
VDATGSSPEPRVQPTGEIGLAWAAGRASAELSAQAVPFTDRFTGDLVLLFQGAGALRWRASPRASFAAIASGGSDRRGDTALAALDARATYAAAERLSVEAGIVGRWQRERGSGAPSFAELGFVVALRWQTVTRAAGGAGAPPAADLR